MTDKLNTALSKIELTYGELVEIANSIVSPIFADVNNLVTDINSCINTMSIDQVRNTILSLQLKAFELSEIKEKSAMKAEVAEALQKEQFALKFNSFEGSAAAKEKLAQVATSEEIAADILYNLVANLFKNKVDQIHRLVAALTSILVSRGQEQKFMNLGTTNEIPHTTNGKISLNE